MDTIDCRPSGRSAPSGLASILAASPAWDRSRGSRWTAPSLGHRSGPEGLYWSGCYTPYSDGLEAQ
jgi:hypothetical protein